jgi:hypothetical protein
MRPASLAEVAQIGQKDPASFWMACDEFCDGFYLQYPDKTAMRLRLEQPPELTHVPLLDAWIGAVGEHLALRWGLERLAWVDRPEHFALVDPVFMPPSKALEMILIAESPSSFRSRMIFTRAEPLMRARFPGGVSKVQMPWSEDNEPADFQSAGRE